jgi:class 3 adenylate cyclase
MPRPTTESILDRLNEEDADSLDLLSIHQRGEFDKLWSHDSRLYRGFARVLIRHGHPNAAIDLIRAGLKVFPTDASLLYLLSLAYRRGGNFSQAQRYLDELLKLPNLAENLQSDAWSLQGAICKELYRRSHTSTVATESAEWYLRAFELTGDLFPAINAATMFRLGGDLNRTRELAGTIIKKGAAQVRQAEKAKDYWLFATLGEAHFHLGQLPDSARCYRKAIQLGKKNIGDIGAMRSNFLLLQDKVEVGNEIWSLFNIGSVVVFAGHMLDRPHRKGPARFPHDSVLEQRVIRAIKDKLDALNPTVAYCSLACGSDVLFAEQALARQPMELHVVLPFHKDDFYYTSVDFGEPSMKSWRARCDAIFARKPHVHYATTEHYLGDDVLFDFVNSFMQGLALTRAAERGVEARGLILVDESSPELRGGTRHFLETWRMAGRSHDTISLTRLRSGIHPPARTETAAAAPPPKTVKGISGLQRKIKVMLFADVKDSSKLPEEQSPTFHAYFLDEVHKVITRSRPKPRFCNTWGDGLYVVFDDVKAAADFALRLLDQVGKVEWEKLGIQEAHPLRIGLHTGPVYQHRDPILKRDNYFGSHVVRAARIEPKTVPGCVYTSEQFAAALAVASDHSFVCEFVGIEELAKGYDRCPLYRLDRVASVK